MLKKILASVSALALALGMIALVAGPASAHTGDLNVVAVCNTTTGNYDFTATLVISQTNETGATYWKVGNGTFAGTPSSNAGLPNGPVASTGAVTITLTTFSLPGTTTGLGPWVYAFTTWSPDNFTKGSDGQLDNDHALSGNCSAPVSPTAPTFTDAVCSGGTSGNGSYTIPSMTGVQYTVSTGGSFSNVSAGTYSVTPPKTVTIKAAAKSGSGVTLTGTTTWTHTYSTAGTCKTSPVAPTATDQVCTVNGAGTGVNTSGYITIPATAHVQYKINGTNVSAGNINEANGTYTVTATALDGYAFTSGSYPAGGWSLTIHAALPCGNVTPTAPTVTDQVCTVNGAGNGVNTSGYITIPASTTVNYFINGVAATSGTHNENPGTYTVTATAVPNYTLTGYPAGGWSLTVHSALPCGNVTPTAPTVKDQICTVNGDGNGVYTSGYITIPSSTKVNYFINGVAASAGNHNEVPGTYTVTATAVPNYTLVGYPAGGWSLTINAALACGKVTPAPPTVTDEVCTVNVDGNGVNTSGYITIPSSTKVNYFINGVAASAGNHNEVPGTYTVTATPMAAYTLIGYPAGGWSLTINAALPCGNVTPAAPTVTDQVCTVGTDGNGDYTSGYITIPSSTKVNYFINGVAATAGNHDEIPGTYTVTATAVPNYTLTGYPAGGWSLTINTAIACGNVTPTPPSVSDETCLVDGNGDASYTPGSITIPASSTVDYFIDGVAKSAGTYSYANGTYTVTAAPKANYTLVGYPVGGWSLTINAAIACGDVTPTAPTVTDEICTVNNDGNGSNTSGSITIPASSTVDYFIDGTAVGAGTHDYAPGTYQVTVVPEANYTLVGYPAGGWSVTIDAALPCGDVHPVDPIVVDQSCVVNNGIGSYVSGYIDLPAAGSVTYFIDGVAAGTHNLLAPGTYQVTAQAVPNYTLVGYPAGGWSETINSAAPCGDLIDHPLVTPIVTAVQLTCTTGGSFTLSNDLGAADAVIWTVDGSPVVQGTFQVTTAKTVNVHADANGPAYGFTAGQQQDWTLTFSAVTTTCDLKTLALTGTTPAGGMLLAYFMLLAGLGIITVRAVRRHGRPQE